MSVNSAGANRHKDGNGRIDRVPPYVGRRSWRVQMRHSLTVLWLFAYLEFRAYDKNKIAADIKAKSTKAKSMKTDDSLTNGTSGDGWKL